MPKVRRRRGTTATEYGLIAGGVSVAMLVALGGTGLFDGLGGGVMYALGNVSYDIDKLNTMEWVGWDIIDEDQDGLITASEASPVIFVLCDPTDDPCPTMIQLDQLHSDHDLDLDGGLNHSEWAKYSIEYVDDWG
jgi:Flp pilus assembly pilin Flp